MQLQLFSQIGKVYLLNLDFSADWKCFNIIGIFFSQYGKKLVPETRPQLCIEKKNPDSAFLY